MNSIEVMATIKASKLLHYVYILHRPNGVPFYVGVGTSRRILDHEMYARCSTSITLKLSIIRKIQISGGTINYEIDSFHELRCNAEDREIQIIERLGRRDLKTGPLANHTSGGEGTSQLSPDTLEKKSIASKAAWLKRDHVAAMAHLHNSIIIEKSVRARNGKPRGPYGPQSVQWMTDKIRKQRSDKLKADPISKRPEVRAKISASKLGVKCPNHWTKTPSGKAALARGNHPRAKIVIINGKEFGCIIDAAEFLGVARKTIMEAIAFPLKKRIGATCGKQITLKG